MHTNLTSWLLSALILCNLPTFAGAQIDDDIISFPEALACPAQVDPATDDNAAAGANVADRATDSRSFDYSLLQKKRQRLASQNRPSPQVGAPLQIHGRSDVVAEVIRSGPLTGRQIKLMTRAAAAAAAAAKKAARHSKLEAPDAPADYRSLPDEPETEAPHMPLPTLSTALSAHGQAPLQRQIASATTGLHAGAGPRFAASGDADHRPAVRRRPASIPSGAQTILRLAGGV